MPSSTDLGLGPTLAALLQSHGLPLLGQAEQLGRLLSTHHPAASTEIQWLLQAMAHGVPQALLQPASGEPVLTRAARLAHTLGQSAALPESAAHWAVHTWQQGLGLVAAPAAAALMVSPAPAPVAMPAPPVVVPMTVPVATPLAAPAPVPAAKPRWLLPAGAAVLVAAGAGGWFTWLHSSLEITGVRTAQTLFVGDGKPQPVTLSYRAKNADISAVEVRFVHGDGNWTPPMQTIAVSASASADGQLQAGTLSQRANAPMNATFAYTLVSRDGKRSAPFERSFNVVPPLLITGARLSAPPRQGQPYSVQLAYKRSSSDIVQIVRRVVDSSVPWAQNELTLPVTLNQDSGSYSFAMDPPNQPMRSTVEFEMVDAKGLKSDPVRVAINVNVPPMTYGPAVVLQVVQVRGSAVPKGTGATAGMVAGGAIGSQFGRGNGRAAATLLGGLMGAVAGNTVEGRVREPDLWETSVRFDDGNTRQIRHVEAPRWSAGQRVMVTASGAVTL